MVEVPPLHMCLCIALGELEILLQNLTSICAGMWRICTSSLERMRYIGAWGQHVHLEGGTVCMRLFLVSPDQGSCQARASNRKIKNIKKLDWQKRSSSWWDTVELALIIYIVRATSRQTQPYMESDQITDRSGCGLRNFTSKLKYIFVSDPEHSISHMTQLNHIRKVYQEKVLGN